MGVPTFTKDFVKTAWGWWCPIPVVNAVLRLWGRLVKEGLHAWYTLVRPAFAAGVTSPGPPGEPLATGAVLRLAVGQALHGPELDAKAAEAKGVTHPTKPPVSWAVLTRWGFTRDYQTHGVVADWGGHGGTDKAVCLWSQDLVDTLEAEGHKVRAGTCGENLTVSISKEAWAELGPGDFFWLPEPEILLEITEYAGPCKNQGKFFLPGASFNRINHHVYPGCSRLYTKVVRNGCGIVSQGNVVAAFKGGTGMAPGPEKIE